MGTLTQPLTDGKDNAYIFRLTAAEPAHAPADLNSVVAQVTKDWKTAQAYELAKAAAQKAFNSAKTLGLSQMAQSSGVLMVSTGQFAPRSRPSHPQLPAKRSGGADETRRSRPEAARRGHAR